MAIKQAITVAAGALFGLLSGAGVAAAKDPDLHCEISSDYHLMLNARSLILIRESGTAAAAGDAPGRPVRRRPLGGSER